LLLQVLLLLQLQLLQLLQLLLLLLRQVQNGTLSTIRSARQSNATGTCSGENQRLEHSVERSLNAFELNSKYQVLLAVMGTLPITIKLPM